MRGVANHILTTRGVNSRVRVVSDGVQKYTNAGHIGLYDFDGNIKKRLVLEETMNLVGINALWRSSKTGYHLWNLSVQCAKDVADIGLLMHTDCKHVSHGRKQDRWVLRIAPKIKDDEIYKDSPKLMQVWCNPTDFKQSLPHYNLLCGLAYQQGYIITCDVSGYNWVGVAVQKEKYMTMTDKLKANVVKDINKKKYPIITRIGENHG